MLAGHNIEAVVPGVDVRLVPETLDSDQLGEPDAAVFEAVPLGVELLARPDGQGNERLAVRGIDTACVVLMWDCGDFVAVEDLSHLALGNDARKLDGSGLLASVAVAATRECKESEVGDDH